jgi:hypothetical protein
MHGKQAKAGAGGIGHRRKFQAGGIAFITTLKATHEVEGDFFFPDIIDRKRRILVVSFLDCIQKKSMGKQGKRARGRQHSRKGV